MNRDSFINNTLSNSVFAWILYGGYRGVPCGRNKRFANAPGQIFIRLSRGISLGIGLTNFSFDEEIQEILISNRGRYDGLRVYSTY